MCYCPTDKKNQYTMYKHIANRVKNEGFGIISGSKIEGRPGGGDFFQPFRKLHSSYPHPAYPQHHHHLIHNFTFRMQLQYPSWSDEDIFQSARRLNIATLQNIIAYEYLPAFLDVELSPYTGYKPFTHPGISHEFQSAAFR